MEVNKTPIKACPLYPFVGWHLWKMRNNLVFNCKREPIPKTIQKAIMDHQQWTEAVSQMNDYQEKRSSQVNHILKTEMEVVKSINTWCCFVDNSWVADDQKSGLGWVLMDNKGVMIMKGSTSIDPIATTLEA